MTYTCIRSFILLVGRLDLHYQEGDVITREEWLGLPPQDRANFEPDDDYPIAPYMVVDSPFTDPTFS